MGLDAEAGELLTKGLAGELGDVGVIFFDGVTKGLVECRIDL